MSSATGAVLYTGAEVVSLEPGAAPAAALATRGGHIVAVGTESDCRAALAGASDVVEVALPDRCILPGFIDTHLHPLGILYFDMNADLRGARDIAHLQAMLRGADERLVDGAWVVGLQLDVEALAERRLPTRTELDAACAHRPVVVLAHDGHSASGNSRALAAAGIDSTTADPPGGRIEHASDGTLLGPCREMASQLLVGAVPEISLERLQATAGPSFARLSACGITSAGVILQTDEEGPGGAAAQLESLALQLLLDSVPFCTYAILIGKTVEAALAAKATPLHDPAAGRRVGGFKIFADGTFGSATACMRAPFADFTEQSGYLTLDDDELLERMRQAHLGALQVCVHAIGDGAVERCLENFERILAEHPRADHRHRLEHASLVPPELLPRLARIGLHVSTQPLFIHSEKTWLHRRLGAERARYVYPLRSLVDAGLVLGGASDAPVESLDVLHAIECCVTREGFETQQALTPLEAVRMYTRDAARLQFEEHEKGTLAPGKRADLVVLSGNPLTVRPDRISALRVLRTVVGGRVTFDDNGRARE